MWRCRPPGCPLQGGTSAGPEQLNPQGRPSLFDVAVLRGFPECCISVQWFCSFRPSVPLASAPVKSGTLPHSPKGPGHEILCQPPDTQTQQWHTRMSAHKPSSAREP